MRKVLVIIFILCVSVAKSQFNLGLKSGLNVSSLKGDVPYSGSFIGENKTGINYGVIIEPYFNKYLSFKLELNYSEEGASINYENARLDNLEDVNSTLNCR